MTIGYVADTERDEAEINSLRAEIARLRAALRINGLRWGYTDAEIDKILDNN